MTSNGTNGTHGKVVSPLKLAHVVLRTNQFKVMKEFYVNFLGGRTVHENDALCFITYDEEHHRIALIGFPGTQDKVFGSSGLEHIAFDFGTLRNICTAYKQRKALGMEPIWCVNHGPTTSMYYRDPDGNQIETQVDNFDSIEATNDYMSSSAFAMNPFGVDFDPEELCRKVFEGSESEESLKRRPEIGERGIDSMGEILARMTAPVKKVSA